MPKCLRIIGWCVSFSVFVSFYLVVVPSEAVECPCDYFSVPMTTQCWVDPFPNPSNPNAPIFVTFPTPEPACSVSISDPTAQEALLFLVFCDPDCECRKSVTPFAACGNPVPPVQLTPEEFQACQCELQAYVTALNRVAGIQVSGGPPYICSDACAVSIPTLSQYGMFILAGVLGLFTVIGLIVMRRRRTVAGARGPNAAPQ
jgi:hypothetical protein